MAPLDMSLDDMIKNRRKNERGRGGRPRRGRGVSFNGGRMMGAPHRGPLRVNPRPSSNAIAKSFRRPKGLPWQYDLFQDSLRAAGLPALDNGTKLYVSNLDVGVTNEDIRELFSEIGELKRYAIHFNKNGRPNGSAEVIFFRRTDAFQAMKRYNNVQLDGKPMKIEIIGVNSEIPFSARVNVVGVNGRRTVVMGQGFGRARGGSAAGNRSSGQGFGRARGGSAAGNRSSGPRNHGAVRNVRGRGHARGHGYGRGRKKAVEKSADRLDKELDSYHAEAMQT